MNKSTHTSDHAHAFAVVGRKKFRLGLLCSHLFIKIIHTCINYALDEKSPDLVFSSIYIEETV